MVMLNCQRVHFYPSYHPANSANSDAGQNNWWVECEEISSVRFYLHYIDGVGTWKNRMVVRNFPVLHQSTIWEGSKNRFGQWEWLGGATANFCIWNFMLMMVLVPVGSFWSLEKSPRLSFNENLRTCGPGVPNHLNHICSEMCNAKNSRKSQIWSEEYMI